MPRRHRVRAEYHDPATGIRLVLEIHDDSPRSTRPGPGLARCEAIETAGELIAETNVIPLRRAS